MTRDELPAFTRTDLIAFGERMDRARLELDWTSLELDRTLAASTATRSRTGRLFSFELTMPGGTLLPAAA